MLGMLGKLGGVYELEKKLLIIPLNKSDSSSSSPGHHALTCLHHACRVGAFDMFDMFDRVSRLEKKLVRLYLSA
jgi:hypothetical protein